MWSADSKNNGLLVSAVLASCLWVAGCGGGDARYDLSGSVTYDGKPLPEGSISFDPEAGGAGGGFAPIRAGRYDTRTDGRGHLGGPHKVTITGSDGQLVRPNDPDSGTSPLFPPYETTADLPEEEGEKNFEVPAGGA